jgi:integrase
MLPKPWFRKSKKAWYLQVSRGVQKCLGKTRAEADRAYRHWLLEQGEQLPVMERRRLTVAEVAQEFLDHSRKNNDEGTYQFYCYFVVPFVERFGSAPAATFPPLSFIKWLDEHDGWKGARRNAIIALKRMFNWAANDAGLLVANPLRAVKKPPKRRRNRVMTPEERDYVFGLIRDEPFRQFVFALLDTGCRPSEVMRVSARNVSRDGTRWTFEEHKTDGQTGEARVVYLSPAMQELTRVLVERFPEGPLFRSTRRLGGVRRHWTRNGIRCRFKRLREKARRLREQEADPERRKKLPDLDGLTSYVLRHTFTTHALTTGLPVPVVSALLGHRSIKMVDEHYNHTDQATDVLRDAAQKAAQRKGLPPTKEGPGASG